ncbi:MAG: helix-turn-helix transcriptional regulator [Erysipelothrix sp.]|nr:helix-turn-helix transcriptional regulator [Erysipelothrix sp.]
MENTKNQVFSMRALGKRISDNRKRLNLTQNELAEKLFVTYQAVSSWENGLTAPEISKLIDLAQIFNLSIDELMGHTDIAEAINKYDNQVELEVKDVSNMSSFLKPQEFNHLLDDLDADAISYEYAIAFMPYADSDFFDKWFEANKDKLNSKNLVSFYPFLDQKQLNYLIETYADTNDNSNIATIFPFLDEENLETLLIKSEGRLIVPMAPFLSSESLSKHAKLSLDVGDYKSLVALAPFLSSEFIKAIVNKITLNGNVSDAVAFFPFM